MTYFTSVASPSDLQVSKSPTSKGNQVETALDSIQRTKGKTAKQRMVKKLLHSIEANGGAITEDSTVWLFYHGRGKRVSLPGDLNGWKPTADTMERISGTDLFFIKKTLDPRARFEYKIAVDSNWILDPLNPRQVMGGYGPNSEVWMPAYRPPSQIQYRSDIQHGTLDTLMMESAILGRTHPAFVYKPYGYQKQRKEYPSIYVTDGGEYIALGMMLNILDNLIADQIIEPIVAVFIDPRTDIDRSETSMRMQDYTMSDSFLNFLTKEVRPYMLGRYNISGELASTAIMGASLGGLISTYAAFRHYRTFGLAAAQSPSYWWKDEAMIDSIVTSRRRPFRLYMDTGTIRDALPGCRRMASVLKEKGYDFIYNEYPEAHNWANWRARIADILTYFFPKAQ